MSRRSETARTVRAIAFFENEMVNGELPDRGRSAARGHSHWRLLTSTAFAADSRSGCRWRPPATNGEMDRLYVGAGGRYGMWNQGHTVFDCGGHSVRPGIQTTTAVKTGSAPQSAGSIQLDQT